MIRTYSKLLYTTHNNQTKPNRFFTIFFLQPHNLRSKLQSQPKQFTKLLYNQLYASYVQKKTIRRIHCSYLERHLHSIQTTQVTNLVDHYTTPSQLIPWKPRSPFSLCILKDLFFAVYFTERLQCNPIGSILLLSNPPQRTTFQSFSFTNRYFLIDSES